MTANGQEEHEGSAARFVARGEDEILRLCAILSLGMCEAISHGLVGPDYACHRLFRPALLARARAAATNREPRRRRRTKLGCPTPREALALDRALLRRAMTPSRTVLL